MCRVWTVMTSELYTVMYRVWTVLPENPLQISAGFPSSSGTSPLWVGKYSRSYFGTWSCCNCLMHSFRCHYIFQADSVYFTTEILHSLWFFHCVTVIANFKIVFCVIYRFCRRRRFWCMLTQQFWKTSSVFLSKTVTNYKINHNHNTKTHFPLFSVTFKTSLQILHGSYIPNFLCFLHFIFLNYLYHVGEILPCLHTLSLAFGTLLFLMSSLLTWLQPGWSLPLFNFSSMHLPQNFHIYYSLTEMLFLQFLICMTPSQCGLSN